MKDDVIGAGPNKGRSPLSPAGPELAAKAEADVGSEEGADAPPQSGGGDLAAANAETRCCVYVAAGWPDPPHLELVSRAEGLGPFQPPPVSSGASRADCFPAAVGIKKLQTWPPVFTVHVLDVRTARKL